jgi:hypothetical protein
MTSTMIVNQACAWRFVRGFSALLLATTCTVASRAAESGPSELTYGIGKVFHTSLSDAQLLGQLPVLGKEPILVFSGRPRVSCSPPYCDAVTGVYTQWASNGPNTWNGKPLRYPGDYYDSASQKLLARVRMFIGRCVDSRDVIVWFIDSVDKRAEQSDSLLRTQAEVDFVQQSLVTDTPLLAAQFPARLDIAVARAAVSQGICTEIPPRPRLYTTAAAYMGPPPPPFRTGCSTPAPANLPLGPAEPGRAIAYRDKQTDVLLYVESDGRHLAAVSPKGELLWVRDPFVDQNLCPYRTSRPIIVYVGPTSWSGDESSIAKHFKIDSHVVEIRFDSSQFGVVDLSNGQFFFAGQD